MMTIHKVAFELKDIKDEMFLMLPWYTTFISVGNQRENLVVWYECNTELQVIEYKLRLVGTGHSINDINKRLCDGGKAKLLGTVQFANGDFVLHVYDLGYNV